MPDEQTTVDETTTPTNGAGTSETGKDGTRSTQRVPSATIDRSATRSRLARRTAKELETLRTRLKEIEDKDKSEVERLAGTAREAGEKLTAAEHRARDLAIRLAVAETATTLGITGASVKAAVRLLDHGALEFDEDTGEPTNVEVALKALVKEYPMLATDGEKPPPAKGTPQTPKPATNGTTASEREQRDLEGLRATGRYSV
jgi:hypothetical protein